MSRRNFILLIIVLILIILGVFVYVFMQKTPPSPTEPGGGTNFISQFNPFGSGGKTPPKDSPVNVSDGENEVEVEGEIPKLRKVSSMPIAGYTVYQKERLIEVPPPILMDPTPTPSTSTPPNPAATKAKPLPPATEFVPFLRYVDRATGNIFQTFADKLEERKFSSTVIPKVYEALFGNNGEVVVMRYLKGDGRTIETFLGNLPKEVLGGDSTEENQVVGSFLPENITDVSLSGDKANLFYLINSGNTTIGTILNFASNKRVSVFDSTFNEWLGSFPNAKLITLTTRPGSGVLGYAYALDPTTKNLVKIINKVTGLTTLPSPDGKLILYADDNLNLSIFHRDTKSIDSLSVRTLPEKCVWGNTNLTIYCLAPKSLSANNYPDSWYMGEISFNDQIWKISLETGNSSLLVDPVLVTGEEIDGIKPMLDQNENYLLFVNKKDSYLWELNLK
jgi:hypothetical protein